MKNPFNFKDEKAEKPKRSNFDLSFNYHLTTGFGKAVPVMSKLCYPGDSFEIDAAFGLDAMPMPFPVQSGMRANLNFFWVPMRILWKDWEDYIFGTAESSVQAPYIHFDTSNAQELEFAKKFFETGSLADYLGIPTTVAGTYGNGLTVSIEQFNGLHFNMESPSFRNSVTQVNSSPSAESASSFLAFPYYMSDPDHPERTAIPHVVLSNGVPFQQKLSDHVHSSRSFGNILLGSHNEYGTGFLTSVLRPENGLLDSHNLYYNNGIDLSSYGPWYCNVYTYQPDLPTPQQNPTQSQLSHTSNWKIITSPSFNHDCLCSVTNQYIELGAPVLDVTNAILSQGGYVRLVFFTAQFDGDSIKGLLDYNTFEPNFVTFLTNTSTVSDLHELKDDVIKNPFLEATAGQGDIPRPISALPFRAYEAICNAYLRNQQVDPFIKNGHPVYNEWITNNNGGADSTHYELFFRNWELDFLTGALPSPQQGVAPLVGMTALGNITLEDENGITTYSAETDNSGTTTQVTLTSPAASVNAGRTAMNIAAAGMAINDFRNVNSLQRYLEKAIRRGYRYVDQLMSHFGVEPKYDKMDMPVFIGGVSKSVNISKIIQSSPSDNAPLGSFAGLGSIQGQVGHSIRHYCDEHGFLMAILTISPVPSYSQLLPKHFTFLNNHLDYFSPEFSHLGMQPITYDEVCPIQAYQEQLATHQPVLSKTFGYQRPYYDMVRSVDEVHGLMRTSLRDYLINRVFNARPDLSKSFIKIDPEQTNNVFAVTLGNDDKFVGQVSFRIFAKRPLPRTSIPCLE